MERVYSQLEGKGELAWNYDGFSELHLRARLAFPSGGSGKAGVFCGSPVLLFELRYPGGGAI